MKNTKIQWADATWNPWIGCTKVSPGCLNCYAEVSTPTRTARAHGRELWGKGKARQRTSEEYWKQPARWNRHPFICSDCGVGYADWSDAAWCPCEVGEHAVRRMRVFPSLCDWLDDEVPVEWLADFLRVIYETPNLNWILLTKRPENFNRRLSEALSRWHCDPMDMTERIGMWLDGTKPPRNVWILASAEDQTRLDERVPELLKIPAAVRGLSIEPMLGPVRFPKWHIGAHSTLGIDWAIFGGESGAQARPCNVEWIRKGVRQCQAAGVPVFVKQLGGNIVDRNDSGFDGDEGEWLMGTAFSELDSSYQGAPVRLKLEDKKGGTMSEWPEDLRVREWPKL